MRRKFLPSLSGLVLLLSMVVPVSLPAQSSPSIPTESRSGAKPDQQPTPFPGRTIYDSSTVVRATTRLVIVDVIARDKDGNTVTGLTKDDFTVVESGKPQNIRVFSFQKPNQVPETLPPLPPNVFSNVPRYKPGTALNVILMDGLNTSFEHVADTRRLTLAFLRKFSRDEPVAVYGLNDRLELLQDFNASAQAQPNAAIQPAKAGGTFSADRFRTVPDAENNIAKFRANIRHYQFCLPTLITLKALHWIADSLAGFPGRKNLIWISDNFPFNVYTQFSQINGQCQVQYSEELSRTAEAILDNEIAVYPVVAAGLENGDFLPSATANTYGAMGGQDFADTAGGQLLNRASLQTQINDLAKKTGGQALSERSDLDVLIRKSIDDGSTYYTLGYYPENKKWTGDFRGIHVKVNREGVTLRYRLGYFATTTGFAKADPKSRGRSMNEALDPQAPSATTLPFESTFVPRSQKGAKALVKFAIDPRGITFEKQDNGLQHASVDCVVKAYLPNGNLVKTQSSTMNAKLSPSTFSKVMQSSFPCQQSIDLAPGKYLLRLGVIDNRTGVLGTASGRITVD